MVLLIIGSFCVYDIVSIQNTITDIFEKTSTIQDAIQKLKASKIPPTEENVQKLQNEYNSQQNKLNHLYTPTKKIKILYLQGNKPKNEVDFYFSIMSYVDILTQKAKENNIILPQNCKFGLDPYVQKDVIPHVESIELLYKQSKIVAKILTILFESNDHGMKFISMQRESIASMFQIKNASKTNDDSKSNQDNQKLNVKNKKPDVKLDTAGVFVGVEKYLRRDNKESYFFALEFECYTSSLRQFFNLLHDYRLPVVVRKLEVTTPPGTANNITSTEMSRVSMVLEWFLLDKLDKELLKDNSVNTYTHVVTNKKEEDVI